MASQDTELQFHHKASAYGVSGKFLWPIQHTISVRPSCDLPPTGGYTRIPEYDYSVEGLLSFKRAYTEVSGSPNEEEHPETGKLTRAANNLSLSVIEGFNLLDVVSVDRIVSRITTRYFEHTNDIEVVLVGTRFEGFRISGHPLEIELATDIFLRYSTHQRLQAISRQEGETRDRLMRINGDLPLEIRDNEEYRTTIVESINIRGGRYAGIRVKGNVIEIDHVGTLYLGELTIAPTHKHLNMIRWDIGCPAGGDGSAGGGQAGGVRPPTGS